MEPEQSGSRGWYWPGAWGAPLRGVSSRTLWSSSKPFLFFAFLSFCDFWRIEEEYMCEKYKYCSVFERERDRDGRIELDGK